MRKFKSSVTNEKRDTLLKIFPSGKIRGMKISNMSARRIHAIYNKLILSGTDMNSVYIPKKKYVNPMQCCLFDKDYDPLK